MTASRGSAFASTHGVIDGVHRNATDSGPAAFPAVATGLADGRFLVTGIADRTYGRPTVLLDQSDFTAWHFQGSLSIVYGNQSYARSG